MEESKIKQIVISIQPKFDTICKEYDLDDLEDMSADEILYQQGYNRRYITVEEGEPFEILKRDEAYIEEAEENPNLQGLDLEPGRHVFDGEKIITEKSYVDDLDW